MLSGFFLLGQLSLEISHLLIQMPSHCLQLLFPHLLRGREPDSQRAAGRNLCLPDPVFFSQDRGAAGRRQLHRAPHPLAYTALASHANADPNCKRTARLPWIRSGHSQQVGEPPGESAEAESPRTAQCQGWTSAPGPFHSASESLPLPLGSQEHDPALLARQGLPLHSVLQRENGSNGTSPHPPPASQHGCRWRFLELSPSKVTSANSARERPSLQTVNCIPPNILPSPRGLNLRQLMAELNPRRSRRS